MAFPGVLGRTQQYVDYGLTFERGLISRWQGACGTCMECTLCTGMEMLGIMTKQPVVALSQLFSSYNCKSSGDPCRDAKNIGVCAESLWPFWITYGAETYDTGVTNYPQTQLALAARPSADAFADAPNAKLLDYAPFLYNGTIPDKGAKAVAALQAGYVLWTFEPPNHAILIWDYMPYLGNVFCGVGFDSRGTTPYPAQLGFDNITPQVIMKKVQFTAAKRPVFVPPSWAVPPSQSPPTTKVTPMISVAASLSGGNSPTGQITAVVTYPGDANNNAVTVTKVFNPDGTLYVAPPPPAARAAACWFGDSFNVDVNITDGNSHQIALYLLDWDNGARAETVTVPGSTPQTVSQFRGGKYVVFTLSASASIKIGKTAGANAVVSGVFLDPAIPGAVPSVDQTTQGAWRGKYGVDGFIIANGLNSPPAYATVSCSGATYTWLGNTTDIRALQP